MGFFTFMMPYFWVLIPAMVLAFYAQSKVTRAYRSYSQIPSRTGMSGAQVANKILSAHGINDVGVLRGQGHLTDHYDPRNKVMKLSDGVYGSTSIAAISIAAHEAGHVIQHSEGYALLKFRNAIAIPVSFMSNAAMPLFIIGLITGSGNGTDVGAVLMQLGIILFSAAVVFQLVTLPVEIDASKRAIAELEGQGIIYAEETRGAKAVLSAAALTYIAAIAMALANLLRLMLIASSRRN